MATVISNQDSHRAQTADQFSTGTICRIVRSGEKVIVAYDGTNSVKRFIKLTSGVVCAKSMKACKFMGKLTVYNEGAEDGE